MSTKYRVINTLIMNIPICLAIVITAQLLATGTLVWNLSVLNFAIAYVVSFLWNKPAEKISKAICGE